MTKTPNRNKGVIYEHADIRQLSRNLSGVSGDPFFYSRGTHNESLVIYGPTLVFIIDFGGPPRQGESDFFANLMYANWSRPIQKIRR